MTSLSEGQRRPMDSKAEGWLWGWAGCPSEKGCTGKAWIVGMGRKWLVFAQDTEGVSVCVCPRRLAEG